MPLDLHTPDPAARALARRLRDTEDHLAQTGPRTVQGADGFLYLAAFAMDADVIDVEPYPRLDPLMRVGEPPDRLLDFQNDAAIRRLEDSLSGYALQDLRNGAGDHLLARANPIVTRPVHELQVVWLGSQRRWLVLPGGIRWREYNDRTGETTVRQALFTKSTLLPFGDDGWIGFPVGVHVDPWDSRGPSISGFPGYQLIPSPPLFSSAPGNNPPLRSVISRPDEHSSGAFYDTVTWSSGFFFLPIARVQPPTEFRPTPRIQQIAFGSWDIAPFAEPAVWGSTFPDASIAASLLTP